MTPPIAGKRSCKTHSLAQLGAAAEASFPEIAEFVAAAKGWSSWAVGFRYPPRRGSAKPPPLDEGEPRRALVVIDVLAAGLRAANAEPPGS
jgi:hypothetical protein